MGQIEAFEDSNHEVRSLDMVFAGLTVSLLWEDTVMGEDSNLMPHMRPKTGTGSIIASGYPVIAIQERGENFNAKKIKIEITVPDLDVIFLDLALTTTGNIKGYQLFGYSYSKQSGDEGLRPAIGQEDKDVAERGRITRNKDGYMVSLVRSYLSDEVGGNLSLDVRFFSHSSEVVKNDVFTLRFS